MNHWTQLIRPDLWAFNPYSSARDEASGGSVWLNANESPYLYALSDVIVNRYPDKQCKKLLAKIAELTQVSSDQILMSRGSDEAIDLLVRLFCTAGKDSILICPPTYGMYAVSARLQNASVMTVPLNKENGFQLDVPAILQAWQPNTKIIFVCSPNNPTGNVLRRDDILLLCKEFANRCMIVVDEAYIEFSESASLANAINDYDNLIILRTFSKAYGLAGVRFGFLLAQAELIQWLLKIIAPYPLPSIVVDVVLNALSAERRREVGQQIALTQSERNRLFEGIKKLSCIQKIWPSAANYLLFETNQSEKIMQLCAAQGIVLRSMFDKPGLENCIRTSIGLPEENTQLLTLLSEVK